LGIHLGEGIPNKLIPICRPWIGKEEIDAIGRVIDSKWISTGSKTAEFEQKFAEYIGVKHAIAVSSCTAALHLSLVAAGIESGDEIINPIHLLLQQKQSAMLMQFRYLWI